LWWRVAVEADCFQLAPQRLPPDARGHDGDPDLTLFGIEGVVKRSAVVVALTGSAEGRSMASINIFIGWVRSLCAKGLSEVVEDAGSLL
jgi:hypothetical protein